MVDDIQNSDDTASVFGDLADNTATPKPRLETTPDQPEAKLVSTVDHLGKEIASVSDYIKDLETLVIAKVLHKIHMSYYRAWTNDLRHAHGLISRLNRRRTEISAKLEGRAKHDLQTG